MCGLFGMTLPHRYPTDLLRRDAALAFLGALAEERGTRRRRHRRPVPDRPTPAGRRGVAGEAHPGTFTDLPRTPAAPRTRRRHGGLGHTRWATQGSITIANTSPLRRGRCSAPTTATWTSTPSGTPGCGRSVVDRLPGRLPRPGHRPHPWAGQHPPPGDDPGRDARPGRAGLDRHRRHDRPGHGSGLAGPRRPVPARDRPRRRRRPVVGLQPRVAPPAQLRRSACRCAGSSLLPEGMLMSATPHSRRVKVTRPRPVQADRPRPGPAPDPGRGVAELHPRRPPRRRRRDASPRRRAAGPQPSPPSPGVSAHDLATDRPRRQLERP